jgi:hypothetical protein
MVKASELVPKTPYRVESGTAMVAHGMFLVPGSRVQVRETDSGWHSIDATVGRTPDDPNPSQRISTLLSARSPLTFVVLGPEAAGVGGRKRRTRKTKRRQTRRRK